MNEKITITIDVTKIPKDRIMERHFTDKEGHEVVVKELKLDVVPSREPAKIKDGDTWEMWKTHFVALPQRKEERENKVKSVYLGNGIMFKKKKVEEEPTDYPSEDIDPTNIPF